MFLALLVEALLVLLVLTLGSSLTPRKSSGDAVKVVEFKATNEKQQEQEAQEEQATDDRRTSRAPAEPADPEKTPAPLPKVPPEPAPPPLIRLSPSEMAAMDIAAIPKRPAAPSAANRPKMGPPDTGPIARDTPRVSGSGPNGEPLYAASWYREPYDDELRGYLSTASGPGWGLIACRTAPDFRVEGCVKVDEYPTGSNIARSVLAAAWQFRVRPPRIGGESKIGEWVRIRIDYEFVAKSRH